MSPVLIAYFAGMASAFGISTAFVIFCMWFAKRTPGPEQHEQVMADDVDGKPFCPPSYHLRLVRK